MMFQSASGFKRWLLAVVACPLLPGLPVSHIAHATDLAGPVNVAQDLDPSVVLKQNGFPGAFPPYQWKMLGNEISFCVDFW